MAILNISYGQIETKYYPNKNALEYMEIIQKNSKASTVKILPSFDIQKLIDEDKITDKFDLPYRFGKGFETQITLKDGKWINVKGGHLWSMEFQSKGAYSINFVFDHFYLADSVQLYISNNSNTVLYGPVTSQHNTKSGYFLTDLIQGDIVTIYLFEPDSEKGKSELSIKSVVHAYRGLSPEMAYGNTYGSEECNNDIACFPTYDLLSDAVALVLLSDGTELCSGSLLMTANKSFRPYFLSAFHCIDTDYPVNGELSSLEISRAENWLFKFQYKMESCDGYYPTDGITYNGATFRAAYFNSDFSLLEMDNSPVGDERFSWLGWDRSATTTPTRGSSIHHPAGDVMKISIENSPFQTSSWNGTNNHWKVYFDDGVVEKGSSGAPIFDQYLRVRGQLHGNLDWVEGEPFCDYPRGDYGRFNVSWTGGSTNSTRLSNWLDPCSSGASTTSVSRSPLIEGPTLICSGEYYFVDGLPSGADVIWNISPVYSVFQLTQDAPSTNQVIVHNKRWYSAITTLIATINLACGGDQIVLTKTISTDNDNSNVQYGSYNQEACTAYNQSFPSHSGTLNGSPVFLYPGCMTEITLNNMFGRTVSIASGSGQPLSWMYLSSNSTLYLQLPNQSSVPFTFNITGDDACYSKSILFFVYSGYSLVLSPNPTTGETILSIESTDEDMIFDENAEWEMEVYDPLQNLKEKKTKIMGKSAKLQTAGWKEGVYIVRVLYKDKVLTGKLVVKK